MTDRIAILIPCYNESQTITTVIEDFKKVLPQAVIYVYDNNSTDNCADLAKKAGAVVRFVKQQGKGNVVRQMFKDIKAECYVLVDGDDTYPADIAPKLIAPILNKQADIAIGDRLSSTYFTENKRLFHGFGNKLICRLVNILFSGQIKDILTGYRALSPHFIENFPCLSQEFELETEISIYAICHNFHTLDISINYRDRPQGSASKLHTYKDGLKIILMIIHLYRLYHPKKWLLFITFILFFISMTAYFVLAG